MAHYLDPKNDFIFKRIFGEHPDEIIHGLEFVLVELKKFRPESVADRKLTILWLRFMNEVGEKMRSSN
jgi:hypothetical protein